MKKHLTLLIALYGLYGLSGLPVQACAACYNANAGSKMGAAANWGIIAMTVIMVLMLGALFAAGCYFNWRSKHPLPDYSELLAEEDETVPPDALPDAS